MIESIAIRSKKQTSVLIFFFFIVKYFCSMFMMYWSSRVESVLILNIAYFLTLFVRKYLCILIEQRKRKNA